MNAMNGMTANRAALEAAVCPVCGAGLAMPAHMAPTLSCLSPECCHTVDLAEARELAAGWAVAVKWMEATAAVLDGEG
jgi:hypothetical protein